MHQSGKAISFWDAVSLDIGTMVGVIILTVQ